MYFHSDHYCGYRFHAACACADKQLAGVLGKSVEPDRRHAGRVYLPLDGAEWILYNDTKPNN
jgi:hypothetical protein